MVDSPVRKPWQTWNICRSVESYMWETCIFLIQHGQLHSCLFRFDQKKVKPEVQICDRRANEYRVPYRLGGRWIGRKSGCRCSLERISKFYPYRHIKTKLKIKINIHLNDFWHQICQKRRIIVWKWQM